MISAIQETRNFLKEASDRELPILIIMCGKRQETNIQVVCKIFYGTSSGLAYNEDSTDNVGLNLVFRAEDVVARWSRTATQKSPASIGIRIR